MKQATLTNNKDFVNLHTQNRKRKLNDSFNSFMNNASNIEMNENENMSLRKIVKRPSVQIKNNSSVNSGVNNFFSNDDIDVMYKEVGQLNTPEEIKNYLNFKLTKTIGKKFILFSRISTE
jgi:hypothetical protein